MNIGVVLLGIAFMLSSLVNVWLLRTVVMWELEGIRCLDLFKEVIKVHR